MPPAQPAPASPSGAQSVAVTIAIPTVAPSAAAHSRRPLYISVNTQSAAISVNGGTPVVANLSATSPNCVTTAGVRTCTVAVSAPVGTDTFTEFLYANTTGTGAPLSQNRTSATIIAGKANTVALTLDGVVASVALALTNPAPPQGAQATIPLVVTIEDASKAAIIGGDPFANPVTLTDSDTSGATSLSKTTLNSPADAAAVTVNYSGAPVQATFGASATGVPASAVTPATLAPTATTAFVDWASYGYDTQRSGYNPSTGGITPASISTGLGLHLAWQKTVGGATQSQPVIVTNVAGHQALLIIANYGIAQAYDAFTGALVWQNASIGGQDVQDCGSGGISGTVAYDKALGAIFLAAGRDSAPNHVIVYRLDAGTGNTTGTVDVTPTLLPGEANYAHSGITFANGRIYLGTGSDCEGTVTGKYPSWRGRVVSVDPVGMTLLSTFFTTWEAGSSPGNYGGGGVWSWGGVSADASGNIYVGTGNAETNNSVLPQTIQPPFTPTTDEQAGYAEHLVKLSGDLSTVEGSDYPGFNFSIGQNDLDFAGTPVIYQPPVTSACGTLSATQGKGGTLVINNTQTLAELNSFALSVPSGNAYYIGSPAYSPVTGYLYAAISSAGAGSSMLPPGLAAIDGCGSGMAWHTQFGPDSSLYSGENPRSSPTVTAGGVVFIGTPCTSNGAGGCGSPGAASGALWALDATTGSVLNGGKPIVITGDNIRMAPSADGLWLYVLDDSGNFYAYTVDQSVKAVAVKVGRRVTPMYRRRAN